jgi:hypothetical protein
MQSAQLKLGCNVVLFVGVIKVLFGSLFILGRFPESLKSASVHIVGESEVRRAGVIGCVETGYGEW